MCERKRESERERNIYMLFSNRKKKRESVSEEERIMEAREREEYTIKRTKRKKTDLIVPKTSVAYKY